jgi:hypothetical protein
MKDLDDDACRFQGQSKMTSSLLCGRQLRAATDYSTARSNKMTASMHHY